jgi:hypothetical protein
LAVQFERRNLLKVGREKFIALKWAKEEYEMLEQGMLQGGSPSDSIVECTNCGWGSWAGYPYNGYYCPKCETEKFIKELKNKFFREWKRSKLMEFERDLDYRIIKGECNDAFEAELKRYGVNDAPIQNNHCSVFRTDENGRVVLS